MIRAVHAVRNRKMPMSQDHLLKFLRYLDASFTKGRAIFLRRLRPARWPICLPTRSFAQARSARPTRHWRLLRPNDLSQSSARASDRTEGAIGGLSPPAIVVDGSLGPPHRQDDVARLPPMPSACACRHFGGVLRRRGPQKLFAQAREAARADQSTCYLSTKSSLQSLAAGRLPAVRRGRDSYLDRATTENPSFELNAALSVALPGVDPAAA